MYRFKLTLQLCDTENELARSVSITEEQANAIQDLLLDILASDTALDRLYDIIQPNYESDTPILSVEVEQYNPD